MRVKVSAGLSAPVAATKEAGTTVFASSL